MERKRYEKMFLILILVVAIAGMSLGFAAFSKLLTINASATVTPSQEDFKIVAYGATDIDEIAKMSDGNAPDLPEIGKSNDKWSKTESYQIGANSGGTGIVFTGKHNASISYEDNKINIDGVSAEFFDSNVTYNYAFVIRNEGVHKARVTLSADTLNKLVSKDASGVCTPEVAADAEKVAALCKGIQSYSDTIYNSSFQNIVQSIASTGYELEVNDYIMFLYTVENANSTSFVEAGLTGGFTVQFSPIQMIFDSVA